jgi:hypothetical protein
MCSEFKILGQRAAGVDPLAPGCWRGVIPALAHAPRSVLRHRAAAAAT